MKFLDRIAKGLGYGKLRQTSGKRMYEGAIPNRLTNDWSMYPTSHDQEIRFSLQGLRARARVLARDDAYTRRYIELCKQNVIGPKGVKLQMKIRNDDGTLDKLANIKVEEAWEDWCKRENCTVGGDLTFKELCNIMIEHLVRDGEILCRGINQKSLKYGFSLEPLEPDFLNHLINVIKENGNIVRMGVEFDKNRKPVAYHLTKIDPALEVYANYQFSRDTDVVPADQVYHGFKRIAAFQSRGVTWLAPVMIPLKWINGWEEAALWNARASASKMGFIETKEGSAEQEFEGQDKDAQGNVISSTEPGQIEQLGAGQTFNPYDPKYPEAQHGPFLKAMLRRVASGLGINYNTFGNDYEGVNFSSIRAGMLDERDHWKTMQHFFKEIFIERVFKDWLEWSLMSGAINLPYAKIEKFNDPKWIFRGFDWVDPLKDVSADILALQAGLTTTTAVISENGGDVEEVFSEIQEEKKLAAMYGVKLSIDQVNTPGKVKVMPGEEGAPEEGAQKTPAEEQKGLDAAEIARRILMHEVVNENLPKNGNH